MIAYRVTIMGRLEVDMKGIASIVVGVLIGVMAATPVLAQGQTCLQRNRMQSWKAINDHTLDFTDLNRNHYTITTNSACRGVTDPQAHLVFHVWQNLECLPIGEIIVVRSPVFGATQCSIASVQANGPILPTYGASG